MPVALFVCPHCEKQAEMQVTSVTRSRQCPHCSEVVVLQVAAKDKKSKRRALLVSAGGARALFNDELLKGVSGPAYDPKPLEGEALDRMKLDPEIREFRRRLIMGASFVTALVILTSLWHFLFDGASAPVKRQPAITDTQEIEPDLPKNVKLPKNTVGLRYTGSQDKTDPVTTLAFTPTTTEHELGELSSDTPPALQAVERFLKANTLTEFLDTIADRALVEPIVRDFVVTHPIVSQHYKKLVQGSSANNREGVWSVDAVMTDGSVKRVHVVMDQGQLRVDWPSYAAWSAMPWTLFMTSTPNGPVLFRVLADEDTYYEHNFSDSQSLRCVRLQNPMDSASPPIFAYVERSSVVGAELDFLMRQSAERPVKLTLRLKYPVDPTSHDQVWIDNVVTSDWLIHDLQKTARN